MALQDTAKTSCATTSDNMDARAQEIVETIASSLPPGRDSYALHEPVFQGSEWQYVKECLDTGWVSSVGKFVDQFEVALKDFTGVNSAVACVNGTAALHIALLLSGVTPGDEVIVPTITFVATANAVVYAGAIPHFVDSCEETLGVDPDKLEAWLEDIAVVENGHAVNKMTGRTIKALIVMHTLGHPVDLDRLEDICERFKLVLIEDAAEALGSYYRGKHVGGVGRISTLSFNGNKVVTTGGGGAILTNDVELGRRAKHLTTTAKVPHQWQFFHDETGYNYRLPNINAALGLAQLEELPLVLSRKKALTDRYREAFRSVEGVRLFEQPSFADSNYWLNALVLDGSDVDGDFLQKLLLLSNSSNLQTRPLWEPMHTLPMYASCPKMDLSIAESLRRRVLTIPSGSNLST